MNFQFYIEKLLDSKEFQKFKKENPTAFLCSGFFSIDKKANDNQQNLDYFIPKINKMFSFKLLGNGGGVELLPVENFIVEEEKLIPKQLSDNFDFEFNDMENLVQKRMLNEKITKQIEKLLWSIQTNREGKGTFLIGTIFISNLGMIKVSIDLNEKAITSFEKKSFLDFIRIVKKKDKTE